MSGFKEGSVQLRKKDIGNAADPNHLKILVDTNNNLYTIDEFGVYRAVAGYDIQVSGTSLTLVTSGATKIISLSDTGVISGSYGSQTIIPAFTVSPDGRILSVSATPISAAGLGTVTSVGLVSNSLVVSSSPITTSGNIFVGLSAIGTSGTFTKIVKDQYGRITSGGNIGVTDILDRSLDGTLSANSDNKIPTEKAIKTYVDENDKRLSVGICDPICYDIIDNGDGTANILSQNVYLYDNPTYQGNIKKYYVSETTLSFVDNTEQLVCIKYNSGNPIFYLENHPGNVNESDIICVHICWRQGNTIHSIGRDSKGLGLANKIAKSILWTNPYSVSIEGGLVLSESSTPTPRTLNITSATVFAGIVPITVSQFNSSVDKLTFSYHQSGNWVYSSSATTYNNFYYDDGNNLQEITNNKFVCLWIYRSIGDIKETFYVVGNNYYNSIESARLESQRSDLPLILRRHCILVGRIIIQKGQNSGIVENISKVNFSNTSIPNHNDLNNIQGGSETERYHISATTYSYLSAVSADIQYQLDNRIGKNILEFTKEPTGFPDLTSSNISFNNSTRTFTISAVSGTFDVYYRGNRLIKTIDQIQIQNVSALNYIYYTSAGILTATHTPWDILTTVQIAFVYWTGVSALSFCEERHGTVMDCATHFFLHNTVKTRYVDGFDSNYTLRDSSKITFGLTDGRIADEDLTLSISNGSANSYFKQPINSSAYIPVYYRQGLNGDGSWRKDTATIYPFKNNGGTTRVAYNQLSGSTWVQSEAPSNTYVPYYIFATNIISEPIISIQGQRYDSNINESRNNARPESLLVGDFPTAEAKLLYTLIVSTNNGYTQNPLKARIDDVVDYRSFNVTIGGSIGGTGTVTYVGLSANSILTISGSPVIDAGTFLVDFSPQLSSTFLRGPTSGSSKIPTFGPILSSDIPNISNLYLPLSGGSLSGQLKCTTVSASGNVSGNSFVKIGGTSNQFLKADGSVDSNVYITSSSLTPYALTTTVSAISGSLQSQITNNNNKLSAYLPLSGGTLTGQLKGTTISASGNVSGNSFVKIGGTSNQFLKADGSVDSNDYITTTTTSAISANLQSQIDTKANSTSLSAYLPLSGGNVFGRLYLGNSSNNGYLDLKTNGTSAGQTDINYRGGTSALRRMTIRYDEIKDAIEIFSSNDDGSARLNIQRLYRDSASATNFYTGVNIATGNFSIQALSASKLVATNSSKNLISYVLTSGDMPGVLAAIANLPNAEGCLKNTGAGVVTWEKTLPINSYSTLGMSNFTGQSVYVYEALSGRGLGFSDSRGLNWRGGFVSTSAAYGFHQDATSISSFKPFTISDGAGNVWYSQNPLGSSNHTFTGTGRFSSTLSANSFVKLGGTSNQFLKADGSVDSNIYQTVSAYNQSISGFLPLSGGNLTGNLSANQTIKITKALGATISAASRLEILNTDSTWGISPWADSGGNLRLSFLQGDSTWTHRFTFNRTGTLSAFGNITATNFVGTLDGSKNVQSGNETTIANGYANTGGLWVNWRGATSAITEYRMGSGRSDDAYANVKANGFIRNGGSSNQFLKADGSVDSNSFSNYLPLSGGTMTGSILGGMVSATNFYDTGFTGSKVLVSDSSKQIIETTTTTTEVNYLVGVSANVQTQLNALKQNSLSGIGFGTVNRITKFITTSSVGDSTISDNGTVVSILNAVSAGGNITATNFVGTLDGSKNVQFSNETTIANNYNSSDGNLWINYRGAIQSIKMYNFVNGFGKNYSGVMASAFKLPTGTSTQFLKADGSVDSNSYATTSYINNYLPLSGGTLTGNLKISAVSEGWSEGVRIMATSGNWGGFRLTRTSSPADIEDNWAVGYANNSTGNLEYDVYTSGSQLKHTIFYKNGNVYHLGNVQTSELIVRDSALISTGTNNSFVRIKSSVGSNNGYIEFGTGSAFFGYSGTVNQFLISGHFVPSENNVFDLGENLYRWRNLYCNNIYENGSLLSNRYLPLSGGTMTGDINFSNPVIGNFRGLRGTVGNSDVWRIGGNSNSDDNGFIEIVTGDNGDEPIYVRQEKAYDDMLIRTATLLDGSGNTSFPGFLSATKIYITANNQQNLYIGNDASLGDADIDGHVRLQGRIYTNMGYITYGDSDAYFGFDSQRFVVNRNIRPYFDGDLDLGGAGNYWANVYSDKFIRRNGLWDQFLMADGSISYGNHLSSTFLPLSGGIMTGSIRGNGFDSGSTAIISSAGYGNFNKISVRHSGSFPPTDINFVGSAYLGGWIYQNTYSKFYNSSTSKSNALIICEGNDSGYGGLYFGGRGNSYIGQTSDGVLHIRGLNGIEFDDVFTDDYGITFNQNLTLNQNITNHITYTTATDSSNVFPDDRTYYKITVNGDKVLPTPVESKVIYIYNAYDGMGPTYLKAPSGVTIYYYNFSGLNKSCSGSQKIQIPNDRTIALIGNSSTKYSIIGQWGDPV